MNEVCRTMEDGEVVNADKRDYPLYEAKLYGDKLLSMKFSKRLSCAVKHLPIRIRFHYEYDTLKALEAGVSKDPTLVLNGKIFLEGLVSAEEITHAFELLLNR